MNTVDFRYLSNQFSEEKQYFNKGAFIYMPEQLVKKVFLIHKGIVKLGYYNSQNDSVTKAILYEGDVFNIPRLMQKEAMANYAEVISTTAQVSTLSSTDFWRKIKGDVEFQYLILDSLTQRITDLEKRWVWITSLPIEKRVIAFIVDMGLRDGQKIGFEIQVLNPFTHLEIGQFIGASRQTVTTIMTQLQKKNLIYYNRKKILIRDLEELQEIVGMR